MTEAVAATSVDEKDRRRFGRLRTAELQSSLGRVLDLSGGGMRVESRWPMRLKATDRVLISLVSEAGEVDVRVEVSWVKSLGLFRHQAGLEFRELTAKTRALLVYLCQVSAPRGTPAIGWSEGGR